MRRPGYFIGKCKSETPGLKFTRGLREAKHDMKNFSQEIQQAIAKADPERLNGYIEMFDRLLLYDLAVISLPRERLEFMMGKWEELIKYAINTESCLRTDFLESTPQGRIAKMEKQPDGEEMRLLFLHTLNTAKTIIAKNLTPDHKSQD